MLIYCVNRIICLEVSICLRIRKAEALTELIDKGNDIFYFVT